MPKILSFTFNAFRENTYVVDFGNGNCIIIDPGFDSKEDSDLFFENIQSLNPLAVLLSHGHFDHAHGVNAILEKYDIPVYLGNQDKELLKSWGIEFPSADISDGQILDFGADSIKVIATPGHSQGSVCYQMGDILFSGDTLFADTIGRTDLPGGDYDQLIVSLMEKVMILDTDTKVLPGHGPSTNIGHERTHNPFLQPFNEPEEEIDPDAPPIEIKPLG